MSDASRCIIILSTKSAGSSAVQELICRFAGGKHIEFTRHGEFETLYWTKAASVLGLPQLKLPDSEVPIPAGRARRELRQLLARNLVGVPLPADNANLIVEGWRLLAERYHPIFVEKSPHHLHQWSCLNLMVECARQLPELDFRFVGLVRNPMDVLYSAWRRWRTRPEQLQTHWRMAYQNLEKFKQIVDDRLVIVRYEDLSSQPQAASNLLQQLQLISSSKDVDHYIHGNSMLKWKNDSEFGFQLAADVAEVAARFGYTDNDISNAANSHWRVKSAITRFAFKTIRQPVMRFKRAIRQIKSA